MELKWRDTFKYEIDAMVVQESVQGFSMRSAALLDI